MLDASTFSIPIAEVWPLVTIRIIKYGTLTDAECAEKVMIAGERFAIERVVATAQDLYRNHRLAYDDQ